MIELIIGCAVAGATYAYAKRRKATTGTAAGAAALTGAGSAAVTSAALFLWPLLLLGGVGYWWLRRPGPRALGPGRDS